MTPTDSPPSPTNAGGGWSPDVTLIFRWLQIPNVTLEQASWLIMGFDPLLPPIEREPSTASASYKHRDLVNRLESAVAAGKLRPVSNRHGLPILRFNLQRVFTYIGEMDLHPPGSAAIKAMNLVLAAGSARETRESRMQERMQAAREFVRSLPDDVKRAIKRKPREAHPRRTRVGAKVNVELAMNRFTYDPALLHFLAHSRGAPGYNISPEMLQADRRALNIQLKRGLRRKN